MSYTTCLFTTPELGLFWEDVFYFFFSPSCVWVLVPIFSPLFPLLDVQEVSKHCFLFCTYSLGLAVLVMFPGEVQRLIVRREDVILSRLEKKICCLLPGISQTCPSLFGPHLASWTAADLITEHCVHAHKTFPYARQTPDAKPLLLLCARRLSSESIEGPLVTLAEVEAAHDPAGTFVAGTMLRVVIVPFDNACVGLPTNATGVCEAWLILPAAVGRCKPVGLVKAHFTRLFAQEGFGVHSDGYVQWE